MSRTHKHHEWKLGESPPVLRPHSYAKHRVLKAYLERYVSVLTTNPRQDRLRLTLVDGFAGGGRYLDARTKEERPGSPLLMLDAMKTARQAACLARSKPFHLDVEYFFIEHSQESFDYLQSEIQSSEYKSLLADGKIRLIRDTFQSQVPTIIDSIENRGSAGRSIFFLDQFGYADVPLPTVRSVLARLNNAEVILTFATDSLIDYLSTDDKTQQTLQNLGLSLPQNTIADAKASSDWRQFIQFELHQQIPTAVGAKFYTPFFIRSTDAHRDYWLIHLSGHFKARDVMMGLHWQESTSFAHYGRAGINMLGYDQTEDQAIIPQQRFPGFYFDDDARTRSQAELAEQLPKHIWEAADPIQFKQLLLQLTNETPVTAEIMKGVLNGLAREGLICVRDMSGLTKRRKGIQEITDVIIPVKHRQIFMPWS